MFSFLNFLSSFCGLILGSILFVCLIHPINAQVGEASLRIAPLERALTGPVCVTRPLSMTFLGLNPSYLRDVGSPEDWNDSDIREFLALAERWLQGEFYASGIFPRRCPVHHRMVDLLIRLGEYEAYLDGAWERVLRDPDVPWNHHLLSLLTSRKHQETITDGWMHLERLSRWPAKLRLTREGNVIRGSYSFDGEHWHVVQRDELQGVLQGGTFWVGWFCGVEGAGEYAHSPSQILLDGQPLPPALVFTFPIGEKAKQLESGKQSLSIRSETTFPFEKSKLFQGLRLKGDFDLIMELGKVDFPPDRRGLIGLSMRFGLARVAPSVDLTLQSFHRLTFVHCRGHNNEAFLHLKNALQFDDPDQQLEHFKIIRLDDLLHLGRRIEPSIPEMVRLTRVFFQKEDPSILPNLLSIIRNELGGGEVIGSLFGHALMGKEFLTLSDSTWHHFLQMERRSFEHVIPTLITNLKATDHRATGIALEKRWETLNATLE